MRSPAAARFGLAIGGGGFLERARALGVEHAAPAPVVMGRHLLALGVPPGPRMGVLLREVYEHQLDGRVQTLDEGIALARTLLDAPEAGTPC